MKSLSLTIALLLAASAASAQDADGKALYTKNCQKCHGPNGTPSAAMAKMNPTMKAWTAADIAKLTDEQIVTLLTNGSENGKKKAMKDKMTADEMMAVAKYVHAMMKGA